MSSELCIPSDLSPEGCLARGATESKDHEWQPKKIRLLSLKGSFQALRNVTQGCYAPITAFQACPRPGMSREAACGEPHGIPF